MHRTTRYVLVLAGLLLGNAAVAAEAGHCREQEQTFFNCKLHGGKVVSVCGSKKLTTTSGYLQYRFGAHGRLELEFPASTTKCLSKRIARLSELESTVSEAK